MITLSARFTRFCAVGVFSLVFAGWCGTARADDACKPAAPAKASKCNKDAQCCPGLRCAAGVCQGGCRIGGTFYASGATNGPCQSCQPSVSTTAWTNRVNGTGCTDGHACTTNDRCQAGVCTGTTVVCAAPDECHTAGTCDPATGACSNPAKPDGTACTDGEACTTSDSCQAGVCTGTTVVCAAPDECHTAGTCDPATGACSDPTNMPNGTPCDDGIACTVGEFCVFGVCQTKDSTCHGVDLCQYAWCDAESGECRTADVTCPDVPGTDPLCWTRDCQTDTGACLSIFHKVGTCSPNECNHDADCDDHDACTDDVCGGEIGFRQCQWSRSDCDDFQDCTDDFCDNPAEGCKHVFEDPHVFCDDHVSCTDDDYAGDPPSCDCTHTPRNSACDDGNPCTQDVCDPGTGCAHPSICDDGRACTTDVCDPGTLQCSHIENNCS